MSLSLSLSLSLFSAGAQAAGWRQDAGFLHPVRVPPAPAAAGNADPLGTLTSYVSALDAK